MRRTAFGLWGLLPLAAGGAMAEPTFDCTKAASSAEEAICGSEPLAELDVELARLYAAAVEGPNMDEARLTTLKAEQRGWIKGRDACWKSAFPIETCVAFEYAFRIDDLRTGYADARAEAGASTGPVAFACDGLGALVSAVFVNTAEPMVSLRWRDVAVVLPQSPSASGARYASDLWSDAEISFWTKGDRAILTTANGQSLDCSVEDIG